MRRILTQFKGDGLRSRVFRGAFTSLAGRGGAQLIRLASNLILTRLLFPEAFGLMALIQVFITGLEMFSDVGIKASIIQNKRGDDEDFLNTAWTVQILRGATLALGAAAIAYPVALFYDDSRLAWMLPVVGLNSLFAGFVSTNVATASRHIRLERMTALALVTQTLSAVVMIILAWIYHSPWALVFGNLFGTIFRAIVSHYVLPGIRNRLRWEPEAVRDLFGFGQYIFISTLASFFSSQGDKLLLGRLVSLGDLALYNIGFFLATFPKMLAQTLIERVMFPVYRELRPGDGPGNRRKLAKVRYPLTAGLITATGVMAISGNWIVEALYDPRYAGAGPMLVLLSIMRLPELIILSYDRLLLAEGNSRDFSKLSVARAVLSILSILGGFYFFGIFGVILVPGIVSIGFYPVQQYYVRQHHGDDARHDLIFAGYAMLIALVAIWVNWDAMSHFYAASRDGAPFVTGSWSPAGVFH